MNSALTKSAWTRAASPRPVRFKVPPVIAATSRVLYERLDEIVARYRDLPYPASALETPAGFELVPADEAGLREALQ